MLVTRVWQNGRFMGFDHVTLTVARWYEIVGNIYSSIFTTLGNNFERARSRRRM